MTWEHIYIQEGGHVFSALRILLHIRLFPSTASNHSILSCIFMFKIRGLNTIKLSKHKINCFLSQNEYILYWFIVLIFM